MSNKEETEMYFCRSNQSFVEVNKKDFHDITKSIWSTIQKQQRKGECLCPKCSIKYCDGICQDCKYYYSNEISLETTIDDDLTLADVIASDESIEKNFEKQEQRRRLYAAIPRLKNDIDIQIINLYLQDYTIREIAKVVNLYSTSSVQYRLEKAINELKTLV